MKCSGEFEEGSGSLRRSFPLPTPWMDLQRGRLHCAPALLRASLSVLLGWAALRSPWYKDGAGWCQG